jgi:hypothetical protein
MKFFVGFKIDELIAEHGHKVLHVSHQCPLNPAQLIWWLAKVADSW